MILQEIIAKKRIRLEEHKRKISIDQMQREIAQGTYQTAAFREALNAPGISVIAEIKKASPSKGIICRDFSPSRIAAQYEISGASALSVLTEEDFFLGSGKYLQSVKSFVKIPVLRKDFIIDPWQIYEAKVLGADALLLIARLLDEKTLRNYRELAITMGMDSLVEAHNEEEIQKAVNSGAGIIGINNRDLNTFQVELKNTEKLIKFIPPDITVVSESGIKTRSDMLFLEDIGVDAVLIGETLMKADSVRQKMSELKGEAF